MQDDTAIPELIGMTALEIRSLIRRKRLSVPELLESLENRVREVEPCVNALPTLCFERARAAACAPELGNTLLGGLPVPIKDLENVEGVRTTQGSRVYQNHVPDQSDIVVAHLEANGATVYAKSNTPEFGTGGNTWNHVFGATRNPWNTSMSVAGSSGGAAAALASGMAWLAQGSDMGGSLRNPASFCNVVGLRPTVGRVAANMGTEILDTLSTAGPMARNVRDAALLLDAMCGHVSGAPLSLPSPCTGFLESACSPGLPGKVAYSMDLGITPVDSQVRTVMERALLQLEQAGMTLEEACPDFSGLHEVFHVLRAREYARNLGGLLAGHADVLSPNVAWNIRQGMNLDMDRIDRANAHRVTLVGRVQAFFGRYPVILCPATIVPPYPVTHDHVEACDGQSFENYFQWLGIAYAWTTALCPALSLPCGFTDSGLPVGMQVVSTSYDEGTLLSTASGIEEILGIDTSPINPRITQ